jgi:hypothetical protein
MSHKRAARQPSSVSPQQSDGFVLPPSHRALGCCIGATGSRRSPYDDSREVLVKMGLGCISQGAPGTRDEDRRAAVAPLAQLLSLATCHDGQGGGRSSSF